MNYNRVVIKVDSALIAPDKIGCNAKYALAISEFIMTCQRQGKEIILVSSGSVAAGRSFIDHGSSEVSVTTRRAMAAVGQMKMMANWQRFFDIPCGQILIAQDDIKDKQRFLNIKNTIEIQLANGLLPIVNENDTVANNSATMGDNDNLAALVAQVCEADSLFILSDVDGVFTKDPKTNDDAVLIPEIEVITDETYAMVCVNKEKMTFCGMKTKIEAAEKSIKHGINTYIINGTRNETFSSLLAGKNPGTRFIVDKNNISENMQ